MSIVEHHKEVEYPFSKKSVFIVMKRFTTFCFVTLGLFLVYSCNSKRETDAKIAEIEKKYQDSLTLLRNDLKEARSKIEVLSYPADQRFLHITELFNAQEYEKAKKEIAELKNLFPNASENTECAKMLEKIAAIAAAKKAEEERIKALGFKALTVVQKTKIGSNDVVFSNCKVGLKFIHDVYPTYSGSSWFEHTADKGSKYISFNMDVTSTDKNPNIPTVAFYSIDGSSLIHRSTFWVLFARWDDYGSYLGNEPDLKNDFSKVNMVKFRVGIEIDDEYLNKPYMVVLKKENTQVRKYEKYKNPPVYYEGDAGYPGILNIEDFNKGQYLPIKIENLK